MKNRSLAAILAILLILSLTACALGGSAGMPAPSPGSFAGADSGGAYPNEAPVAGESYSYAGENGAGASSTGAKPDEMQTIPELDGAKIIYSASAKIETRDFDATIEGVYDMLERYGGFLESSSVMGRNYYSNRYSTRTASFTLRVPSEYFAEITGSLSDLGNVPYCNTFAENITSRYVDTESRLNSYRIQEQRLLDLLEKAESLEDMLVIEERLADVRYNIEKLTTDIRGWDSLINYSTLELAVEEVVEYTEEPLLQRTYWQQVGDGLSSTLRGIGSFFKELFKAIIIYLPVLVIIAVIVGVILLILKRRKNNPK